VVDERANIDFSAALARAAGEDGSSALVVMAPMTLAMVARSSSVRVSALRWDTYRRPSDRRDPRLDHRRIADMQTAAQTPLNATQVVSATGT